MSNELGPSVLKAEAIALLCLGYSARRVEKMLGEKFPGTRIPRYATLARWLSTAERTRMAKPALLAMWQQVMLRATLLLNDRIEELLESADLIQIMKGYERIYRMREQSRHVAGYCACANR